MPTNEERIKRSKGLSPEFKGLFDSPVANALNQELSEKYQIGDDKKLAFLTVTGDVILGFNKIADLPRLLQTQVGLDQENARKLTAQLIDAWGPVVEREETEAKTKKEEVMSLANKIEAIRPATPAEEDQAKEVHEPVKAIRTLDADLVKHGYGAMTRTGSGNEVNLDTDAPVITAIPQDQIRPTQQ